MVDNDSATATRAQSKLARDGGDGWQNLLKTVVTILLLSAAVIAVYLPSRQTPLDNSLLGLDYHQLHARRIRYAQESLLADGTLPAWHSRELMGSPFWSNVQNFPFIPTRLILLPLDSLTAFGVGICLAAVLSALFTYGFARRIGLGQLAAAAAGWTFACSGYFASRVMAGYLPLLEAYPALPLLLWLIESLVRSSPADDRLYAAKLAGLSVGCLCIALAGHPQLPIYAFAVAGLYLLFRTRGRWRSAWPVAAAMLLGVMAAAFVLWPMAELTGRSTRVLSLNEPTTDIALPYGRLLAYFFPWRDGWPPAVGTDQPFTGYPNTAYFWDTVCYVGWLPLAAILFLAVRAIVHRRRPHGPFAFVAALGVVSLVTALPFAADLISKVPGTFLRSPSRQLYLTTFALAVGLGAAIDIALRSQRPRSGTVKGVLITAMVLLLAHAIDLGSHGRAFIKSIAVSTERGAPFERAVIGLVGDGRAALDLTLGAPFNREVDDIGFFDSIMLAKPYAALMDISGFPPGTNMQDVDGSVMSVRALNVASVRAVVTTRPRSDLELLSGDSPMRVYRVPGALPRAMFFSADAATFVDEAETHRRLRDPTHDLGRSVMIPPGDYGLPPVLANAAMAVNNVQYQRPSSDEIVIAAQIAKPGFLRVSEAWDPGWTATVNGAAVDVLRADDALLGIALPDGQYEVRFHYSTPGAATGLAISVMAVALLIGLIVWVGRQRVALSVPVIDKSATTSETTSNPGKRRTRRAKN